MLLAALSEFSEERDELKQDLADLQAAMKKKKKKTRTEVWGLDAL